MVDFWENLLRFPRFFVSSTLGLLLTIIGPFFNLLKRPQTTLILVLLIIFLITFVFMTLRAMLDLDLTQ